MNIWVNCFYSEIDHMESCPIYDGCRIYFEEISQIRIQTENDFVYQSVNSGDMILSLYSGTSIMIK